MVTPRLASAAVKRRQPSAISGRVVTASAAVEMAELLDCCTTYRTRILDLGRGVVEQLQIDPRFPK